jgi:hypothetical protein
MRRWLILALAIGGCGTSEAKAQQQQCSRLTSFVREKGGHGGFTFAEHVPALRRAGAGCDGIAKALDLHDRGAPLAGVTHLLASALQECRCEVADLDELERHLRAGLE